MRKKIDNGQLIMDNSELPKGWEIKKLGEICDFQNGFAFKSKTFKDDGIPIVRITNIQNGKLDLSKLVYIDPNDYDKDLSKYKIVKGDLLIAMSGATTGKIGIHKTNKVLLLNQRVGKFTPKSVLNKSFLFNFLETKVEESLAISAGAAQPNLSTEQIKKISIPLPPLPEQKRIVSILDRAFEAIDKAKANAEQNLKNAKELFESYLQEVFENKSDDWEEVSIKNLTELVTKGSSPKWQGINYVEKGGVFFLTSKNVGEGILLLDNKKYLEKKFNNIQKTSILKKGDVLTNIVGASIGRTAIFDLDEITNINQAVCLMRCLPERIYNYYLMYLLNSPFFKNILHDNEVNNARANLSLTFFKNLVIPLPTLLEQKEIVEKIKRFSTETKKLESIYQQKINDLEELKKSILQKAFAGELTMDNG